MKKIAIWAVAFVLALGIAIPIVFAAPDTNNGNGNGNGNGNNGKESAAAVAAAVTTSQKGDEITITVTDATGKTEITVKFEKNATKIYMVGIYAVEVVYNGSKVKSAKIVSVNEAVNSARVAEVEQSYSKTTFHCNTYGGSPRVWPQVGPYSKDNDGKIFLVLEAIPGTTAWRLIDVKDAVGNSLGVPTCPGKHRYCGSSDWISFSNNSGVPDGKNIQLYHGMPDQEEIPCTLTFTKSVAGEPFYFWAEAQGLDPEALAGMMSFELYKANEDGTAYSGAALATAELNLLCSGFTFEADFVTGWYAIVEALSAEGQKIFAAPSPLYVYVVVFDGNLAVTAAAGGAGLILTDFDYGAFYTIVNGYGRNYEPDYIRTLGYPGLNNSGDFFYIGITDTLTGKEYASFCAHAGSKNFAGDHNSTPEKCYGYLVAEEIEEGDYGDFLAAFNYIEDFYGNLDDCRHITQTVIWALLGAVDISSDAFEATNLTGAQKEAIKAVMQAVQEGYTGKGTIVNLVYLVCENEEHTFEYCQPQLVPIYKKIVFINTAKNPLKIAFNKTVYGGAPFNLFDNPVFEFELFAVANLDKPLAKATMNAEGVVEFADLELAAGSYVIQEVWAHYYPDMKAYAGWAFVWDAGDGLYFDIDAKGNVIWVEGTTVGNDNVPVVNNVLFSKHTAFFSEEWYYGVEVKERIELVNAETGETVGWINILNDGFFGAHNDRLEIHIQAADCYRPAIWRFNSANDTGGGFEIRVGEALGHDYAFEYEAWIFNYDTWEYELVGAWYRCTRCGDSLLVPFN